MNSNTNLISIGKFELKFRHLLIIGILSLSFSVSFLLRSQPANYGWQLNEFDPFFNYRATQYLIENGFDSYYDWNDELSWYPHGRDVSDTSQIMLHITTAITYWIFGGGGSLYDFTILFPVVFGSLTAIVIFALVRVIGGTTAGLLSSLLFSISLPIIIRGSLGWFKSEPLGLFFGLLAVYLFLSGIKSTNKKTSFLKIIFAGIFLVFGLSAWGGDQFFIIPLGVFILTLPFLRNNNRSLVWLIPLFTITTFIVAMAFERLANYFIFGLGGVSLFIPTIFLVICIFIQHKSKNHKQRNGLLFLAAFLIIGSSILIINAESHFLPLPSYRYLNAINPFLTTSDALIDSVAEHATTSISQSYLFHSILMIFSGLGIWIILKKSSEGSYFIKKDMISFSLIFGIIGIYVSSAFVRLEIFASLSVIILSSLGISILLKEIFSNKTEIKKLKNHIIKLGSTSGIIVLLMIPLFYPVSGTAFSVMDTPATILNGGTTFQISNNDWLDALDWIKHNTPKDAVVGSWWDYGYWIQTLGERASLADNSTLNDHIIKNIAKVLISNPDQGWQALRDMESDYFIVFVAGKRLDVDNGEQPLYVLGGGADESKKVWFIKIADEPLPKYLHSDQTSGTDTFWNETLLAQMIPFSPLVYLNFETQQQSQVFQPGFTQIYTKDIKLPIDGDGPLRLVYASPSFDVDKGGFITGVFIYEINKDYTIN